MPTSRRSRSTAADAHEVPEPDAAGDDAAAPSSAELEDADDEATGSETAGSWFGPSKSQRKRDSHELQALGEAVIALPNHRIEALQIPQRLLDAILDYKRTKSHEAKRRQLQYIGKLMRLSDPEPMRQAVADMQLGGAREALALHRAETWRAELIASDDALTRWGAEHPESDLQRMRSLIRAARKDASVKPEQRSGRAFRELFQAIRQTLGAGASDV